MEKRKRQGQSPLMTYVVAGTLFVVALVMYLLRFLTKLHHSDQALMPNAPMPAAPGSQPQSVVLAQAAESRRLDSERNRMQHDPARGLRTAGPFPDLPGSVGTVKFEYVNIEHTPDFDNYPPYHTLAEIVDHWNPDDSDNIPSPFLEELQVFNYSDPYELALAEQYRNAEVPFKIHSIPDVDGATERWTDSYLLREMESSHMHYKVEESKNNHFMYWTQKSSRVKKWTPPTKRLGSMTFKTWLKIARDGDSLGIGAEEKHYYLMTGVEAGRLVARDPNHLGQFVSTDLGMFSTTKKNFFITNVAANKGIQCRFGMKGVIAEAHYDGGRNMVAMLKGAKRYILSPPKDCERLSIIKEKAHPSYRHSTADWSNMDADVRREFSQVSAVDTILRQGEVLYIPSFWFHYIISLDYSIQCNSRSGSPPGGEGSHDIELCMGGGSTPKRKPRR